MDSLFRALLLKAPPPGLSHDNKFEVLFPPSPLVPTNGQSQFVKGGVGLETALQLFRKVKKMDKNSSWRSRANCLDCLQKAWDNASPSLKRCCPTCRQKVWLVHCDWISTNRAEQLTARHIKKQMRKCRSHHHRNGKVPAKAALQLSAKIDERPPGSMVDTCSLEDIAGLSRAVDLV
ncbi:hypothetical protein BDZ89DRAFT_1045134 [Hymenopellis radicata]|nr:hypothetical protein BDZ89DRAFT_1045134 [Hymenopellis radicata]